MEGFTLLSSCHFKTEDFSNLCELLLMMFVTNIPLGSVNELTLFFKDWQFVCFERPDQISIDNSFSNCEKSNSALTSQSLKSQSPANIYIQIQKSGKSSK